MIHVPIPRLNKAPVGSFVTLAGEHKPMYVGDRDDDGYSYLWPYKELYERGKQWTVMAAGSIPVKGVFNA